MKKISSQIPVYLILCSVIAAFSAFRVEPKKYKIRSTPVNKYFDVSVGNRTSDSTGSLSINNSGVQQSIIPAIAVLSTTTVTSENCSLMVGRKSAYLIFSVIDTAGVKSSIALQLNENSSGVFSFQQGAGKALHMAKVTGGCNACIFKMELGVIRSSSCASGTPCKFETHYKQ